MKQKMQGGNTEIGNLYKVGLDMGVHNAFENNGKLLNVNEEFGQYQCLKYWIFLWKNKVDLFLFKSYFRNLGELKHKWEIQVDILRYVVRLWI